MTLKKRVTQNDVARRAGVSIAVVSYVINNGPRQTSPELRERVLKAIQELDYHPNAFARGLRARRTNTIAFIYHDYGAMTVFTSGYANLILTGLMTGLIGQGYYILTYPVTVGEDLNDIETLLRSERLDGIVVRLMQDSPATDALLELIAATQLPCVCIERPGAPRFGFSSVLYDNRRGGYDATSYLIMKGHRRIGHVSGERRYRSACDRLEGYRHALAANNLPVDESLIVGGSWDVSTVPSSVTQLLSLAEPPTAIFAASDWLAVAVIKELQRRHYRIPEDIALIGFDDIDLASMITPPLTTVHIPLFEIGQCAADRVLAMIQSEQGQVDLSEVLPVELIERGSA